MVARSRKSFDFPWLARAVQWGVGFGIHLALSAVAAGQQPSAVWHGDVDALWTQILTLLNEHEGYVTRQRLEDTLRVHLEPIAAERGVTTYSLRQSPDSGLSVRISSFDATFKTTLGKELNGAHVDWFISWGKGSAWSTGVSPPPHEGPCLKASRVRSDLLASGWTSPWWKWGMWEQTLEQAAAEARRSANPEAMPHPPEPLPLIYNFIRHVNETAGRDRLPRGQIYSEGDLADSCVTGILVEAKPPPG